MLRFQPKRPIKDVFMNIHNPTITRLLLCNNNVQVGMNGRSILYSTGYQVKSQQKEEQYAFEKVSNVLCKIIRKQASTTNYVKLTETNKTLTEVITYRQKRKMRFQNISKDSAGFLQVYIHIQVDTLLEPQWLIIMP